MSGKHETEPIDAPAAPGSAEIERIAREFTFTYHALAEQTFATTTWLGVPLIKTASDILAFQQIIAATKPELIVETGVYVGGSALLFASIQELCGIDGKVIAIDVDLSAVNEKAREHPRIELVEGSSVDGEVVERIRAEARGRRVMVDLDSDHRAHHVLAELRLYAPLVTPGCYLVVEDGFLGGRPVRPDVTAGPSEAIDAWLEEQPPFEVDRWHERFLMTQNPRGYLRRVDPDTPPPRPPRPEAFTIGSLELCGGNRPPPPPPERALAELEAAAGTPDLEVSELQRKLAAESAQETALAASANGSRDAVITALVREVETQRQLLKERNRLLARERARLARITGTRSYRLYARIRRLPGLRLLADLGGRRRQRRMERRIARRSHARRERTKRFERHHRIR